jgi:chromosome segregation ATPase
MNSIFTILLLAITLVFSFNSAMAVPNSEEFKKVTEEREKFIEIIDNRRDDLDKITQEYDSLAPKKQEIQKAYDEANNKVSELNKLITKAKKTPKENESIINELQNDMNAQNIIVSQNNALLDKLNKFNENKKSITNDIRKNEKNRVQCEARILSLLKSNDEAQSYKIYVSIAFAVMVLLLIIGF